MKTTATKTRTLKTPKEKAQFLWDQFVAVAGSSGRITKKKLHFSGFVINFKNSKTESIEDRMVSIAEAVIKQKIIKIEEPA